MEYSSFNSPTVIRTENKPAHLSTLEYGTINSNEKQRVCVTILRVRNLRVICQRSYELFYDTFARRLMAHSFKRPL